MTVLMPLTRVRESEFQSLFDKHLFTSTTYLLVKHNISNFHIKNLRSEDGNMPSGPESQLKCIVPENIYRSPPTAKVFFFRLTLPFSWKVQFILSFKMFKISPPLTTCNNHLGVGMDSFWNCTMLFCGLPGLRDRVKFCGVTFTSASSGLLWNDKAKSS